MQVIVLATEEQKQQLSGSTGNVTWIESTHDFSRYPSADAFVDLRFEPTADRMALLTALLPKPVVINSVADTLHETHAAFVRINGWNTFLSSPLVEAACRDEATRQNATAVLSELGKKPEWLPDHPGFVTARVVSMIINEAFLALEEGISTRDEINAAMKLGTAYPYGPFEWAEKIGLQQVSSLLQKLSQSHARYSPAPLLVREAAT